MTGHETSSVVASIRVQMNGAGNTDRVLWRQRVVDVRESFSRGASRRCLKTTVPTKVADQRARLSEFSEPGKLAVVIVDSREDFALRIDGHVDLGDAPPSPLVVA